MPTLTAAQEALLAQRAVMRRVFLEVDAVDPDTGAADPGYFYDGTTPITVGAKTYQGVGRIGDVVTVEGTADMSIVPLILNLSGINEQVKNLIRGRVIGQEPMRLYFGIFDTATKQPELPLILMYQGFLDDDPITTPKIGEASSIQITCESVSRELTSRSTDTRSHESQKRRLSTDKFLIFSGNVREREVPFGMRRDKGEKKKKQR